DGIRDPLVTGVQTCALPILGWSGWPRLDRGGGQMTHAALVNDVLLWLVIVMALLLVMFVYAVIAAPPQGAAPAEPPALDWPALRSEERRVGKVGSCWCARCL